MLRNRARQQDHDHAPVPTSRISRAWTAVAAGIVILVVIIVFLLENLKSVRVSFFGATWTVPLAVDLLLAAVLGGLVVFLLGTVRILQLRRLARHRAVDRSLLPDTGDRLSQAAPANPEQGPAPDKGM